MRQMALSVLSSAALSVAALPSQAAPVVYAVFNGVYQDCYVFDFGATPYPTFSTSFYPNWFAAYGQNNTKKNQVQAVTSSSNGAVSVLAEFSNNKGSFQGQLIYYTDGVGGHSPLTGVRVDTCVPILP
jgi:hypothetical protein